MIFRAFLLNVNEANAYVIGCEHDREALLVDAGDFDGRIKDFLDEQRLKLAAIFLTHDHYDHTNGLDEAIAYSDAVVYGGHGQSGCSKSRPVEHDGIIRVGRLEGRVLATPGHTSDSLSLAFEGLVFTGDALFAGSVGGTASPRAAKQQIEHLRKHVLTLPDDYAVYPGHGPASTIAIERQYNPFFV
ncbi:MAG TPA: MBL fold metallo-hydrolase [Candidatus Hydrogenedentes bacterium]|mgnify:CR=1 FL=1|nr:MBL fold metallo-hydrolase [Candidatus Hydrogenedentota bacterium]